MNIAVIGTGYVGLVTGTCLAEIGNQVICVDIDEIKVQKMKKGIIPIYEPGLEVLFKRNIDEKRLSFTTEISKAIRNAEIIFLALPTPPNGDGSADLSYVLEVANELGGILKHYAVIVDKSTVPVGTAEKVKKTISAKSNQDFDVVSNPEFLREGFAVSDFMKPDRIVIGSSSERASKIMKNLYLPFVEDKSQIIFMSESSAEMTKYAANSFLATKISFINEIANLCEKVGANVDEVRQGIGSDERIGKRFLFAGIGYGGSCFPKDVDALQYIATTNKSDSLILKAVSDVNSNQKRILVNKIKKYYGKEIKNKSFGLWGLAFKPDTDDIREAPALEIMKELTKLGAKVIAFDPEAMKNVKLKYSSREGISFAVDRYSAIKNVDALIIATEWAEFLSPDFEKVKNLMKKPVIFDGRNIYNPESMNKMGFYYESIGRQILTERFDNVK